VPELPEVEVLRRSLEPLLIGETVERVVVRSSDLREPVNRRRLAGRAVGRKVEALRRRAKYLLIDLEKGETLIVHLGMSGRLTLKPAGTPEESHEHLAFALSSGSSLRFRDPRRFGLVMLQPTADLEQDRRFSHLGPEPLADDEFSGKGLLEAARGRRGPVKSFLMDSTVVAGVGNIYASEALFRSGIHPTRSVARISAQRWDRLAVSVRETPREAVEQGGTTLNDFSDGEGRLGYFQVSLAVYGRQGEPCPSCGRGIRRIVQSGRSTFYCPGCQR